MLKLKFKQISRFLYEKNFYDEEYMLKKRASRSDLTFRKLKIYYAEKGFHVDDASFESNFNLRNTDGEYNLLAELSISCSGFFPNMVNCCSGLSYFHSSRSRALGCSSVLFLSTAASKSTHTCILFTRMGPLPAWVPFGIFTCLVPFGLLLPLNFLPN